MYTTPLKFEESCYELWEVNGDGSCMYNSVVESPIVFTTCPVLLRKETMDLVLQLHQGGDERYESLYQILGPDNCKTVNFANYLKQRRTGTEWGSSLDMVLVSLIFSVNIIAISNKP